MVPYVDRDDKVTRGRLNRRKSQDPRPPWSTTAPDASGDASRPRGGAGKSGPAPCRWHSGPRTPPGAPPSGRGRVAAEAHVPLLAMQAEPEDPGGTPVSADMKVQPVAVGISPWLAAAPATRESICLTVNCPALRRRVPPGDPTESAPPNPSVRTAVPTGQGGFPSPTIDAGGRIPPHQAAIACEPLTSADLSRRIWTPSAPDIPSTSDPSDRIGNACSPAGSASPSC